MPEDRRSRAAVWFPIAASALTLAGGSFAGPVPAVFTDPASITLDAPVLHLALDDFTGDGSTDIAAVVDGEGIRVLINDGDAGFGAGLLVPIPTPDPLIGLQTVVSIDLEGDGDRDLLVLERDAGVSEFTIHAVTNTGGGFGAPVTLDSFPGCATGKAGIQGTFRGTSILVATDLDADGDEDILISDTLLRRMYINDGAGGFTLAFTESLLFCTVFEVADLNGDSRPDVVELGRFFDGTGPDFYFREADGAYTPAGGVDLSGSDFAMTLGDFDGDGDPDLGVASNEFFGFPETVGVFLNDGAGAFSLGTEIDIPEGGLATMRTGDLNLDGAADIALADSERFIFLPGLGDGAFGAPIVTPGGFRALAIADLDGDSRPDLVSALGGSFAPEATIEIRLNATGATCAGDCDGNGTVDFNDLVAMLFEFGNATALCDADESGTVDFGDLVAALFLFGACQ